MKPILKIIVPSFSVILLSSCSSMGPSGGDVGSFSLGDESVVMSSFDGARLSLGGRLLVKNNNAKAKNVIIFVGDGMGVSTVTAARIYAGQKSGAPGEGHVLAMETLPYAALSKTYNTNQQVSDSAGTATALMTGTKTRAGVINIGPKSERGDCGSSTKYRLETLFETAADNGLNTGVISTARLTHATPAAVYAHSPERNWETQKELTAQGNTQKCSSIADQLVDSVNRGDLDLVMGGGARNIDVTKLNSINLLKTQSDLSALPKQTTLPVIGLFSESHMTYSRLLSASNEEPSLANMTEKSIDILEAQNEGYVLMVEGGRIDHGHHGGKAELALEEAYQFDLAVKAALDRVDLSETLIIVTADHSHVFTIAGYPTLGNPILGQVYGNDERGNPTGKPLLAVDNKPYTTLGYQNGPGAHQGVRNPDITQSKVIFQKAVIPTGAKASEGQLERLSETHGGEDVPVFAAGPSAHLVSGVMEQHVIYHIMRHALGLSDVKTKRYK